MVRKLFKHEFNAVFRIIIPINIILLAMATLGRLVQLFEADTIVYDLFLGSAIFFFVVGSSAAIILTEINGIARFFRNLFSGEGYLSFTLPVTPAAHILVKATVSVLATFITYLTLITACGIIIDTEMLIEIFKAAVYLLGKVPSHIMVHLPLYLVEALLCHTIMWYGVYLLFYACISIGQMAHKARFFAAVGVFFGYYTVLQILATIGMVLFTFLQPLINWGKIINFFSQHYLGATHAILLAVLAVSVLIAYAYFQISNRLICRRLNLE